MFQGALPKGLALGRGEFGSIIRLDSASHSVTMLAGYNNEEREDDLPLREQQEREIALGHSLTCAEHELAREAYALSRTLEDAGIEFDPLTFVALRIVEGSRDEQVDPVQCLNVLKAFGFLDRSVARTAELLDDAA